MKQLSFILILSLFIGSCSNSNTTTPTEMKSTIKYEIVRTDNRDPTINLDVFIQDTSEVDKLNTELISKYNPGKDKYLMIMYFDDKSVAQIYYKKVWDTNTPEKELTKLDKHRIAVYNFNPKTNFDKLER